MKKDLQALEWINGNDLSYDIWNKKYRYMDENYEEWLNRVSGSKSDIKQLIKDKKFLFGGRILANRGLEKYGIKTTLSNCYVITPPSDSIEGIFEAATKMARTFSYGGGCIEENTKIIVKDKGRIPIKDVKVGDYVLSFNIKTHQDEWKKVTNWQYTNVKLEDQIEYVYSNGVRLKTSKLHPILNIGEEYEYKIYQDLKSETHNNKTPNYKKLEYIPQSDIDDIAWFIGCHMGDGTADYSKQPRIRINGDNYNVIEKFTQVINQINNSHITPRIDNRYQNTSVWCASSNHNNNKYIFSNYFDNQINSKTYTWKVPNYIKNNNLYIPFLAGLIDSDGYIDERGHIDISISSKNAIEEICSYLSECGQGYHVYTKQAKRKHEKPLYRIHIYTNTDIYKLVYNYMQHDDKKHKMEYFLDKNNIRQKYLYKLTKSEKENVLNYNYKSFYKINKRLYYKIKQDQFDIKNTNKIGSKPLYCYYQNNIFNQEQYNEIRSRVQCTNIIEDNLVKYKYIDITVEGNQNYYAGEFGFVNIHNCGIDISYLRPKGGLVHNAAKTTSGAVSFMDLYSHITALVCQEGRRGALMLSISCTHPDIIDFINLKSDLNVCTKANISVRMTDEFFQYVEKDEDFYLYWRSDNKELSQIYLHNKCSEIATEYNKLYEIYDPAANFYVKKVKAKEVLELLALRNWEMGEPGILYWDRISGYNVLSNTDFKYAGVNPCLTGDTKIMVFYENNDEDKRSYVPIKDLVGKTPYVLSMNDDGDYVIGKATKVWKTKENAEIVEIITDKKNLKCTPDHRIYTINKGWVEAQYLIKGDIIKSFWYDGKTTDSIVEKVENLNYTEDVYDMTVEIYHNFLANGMVVHNCAEEPLPAGGSCLLGSLNLSTFVKDSFTESAYIDVDDLMKSVKIAVRALNDVLLEGLTLHPLQEQRESVADWRQIGLGITGLGDMLIRLGETYGSDSSLKVVDNVMKNIATTAVIESLEMAKEFGCYPKCEKEKLVESTFITNLDLPQNIKDEITKYGLYNSQLLTIAPTGTLSSLLSVSSGAEPNFAFKYVRKTISLNNEDTYYEVNVPLVEEYRTITDNTELPSCFISAEQIDFKNRIKMQSVLQKYIDASISSTLNLSEDVSVEHVYNIYLEGWKHGLKGCTIWRDNCKRTAILTKEQPKNEEDNKFVGDNDAEKRPKELEADFYTIKHKGIQYTIAVGMLRGRPYEIFAYENNIKVNNLPDHKGVITKIGKNHYSFSSEHVVIDNLVQAASRQEERWITLTTSSQLRHREPLKCIIKTLKKMDDTITSFPNALSRVLSKYLPKQKEKMKETCPECQGELVREGGCIQCKSCGWSKCG